jgi:predicted nucleotidyltransferase
MASNTPLAPQSLEHTVASSLVHALLAQEHLEFAVLVGSRATGTARPDSDWDIALQWSPQLEWLTVLDLTETLRRTLADVLQTAPSAIDLIELRRANLAMRASVAEEGLPLTGQDTLAWAHFLQRTWRDMEDFYWSKRHAA